MNDGEPEPFLPEPPPANRLAFIGLRVSDVRTSTRYYRGVLGCRVLAESEEAPTRTVVVQPTSGLVLMFEQCPTGGRDGRDADQPIGHIALGVSDEAALRDWAAHFDKLALAHSGVVETEVGLMVTLVDPDGISVSVVAGEPEVPPGAGGAAGLR